MENDTKVLPKWLDPNDPDRTFTQRAAVPMLFIGATVVVGGGLSWAIGKSVDRFTRVITTPKELTEED